MAEVFISYARSNETVAKRVEAGLQAAGFQAWRDDQLPAHRAYSDVIEQRLRDASVVVVLWSKDAAQSQWVRAEADFARTQGKLVQAQLDGTLPPLPFNQIQCADLKGWRGNPKHPGWSKLLESVAAVASGEGMGAGLPGAIRSVRAIRLPVLAALGLALLAIAAVVTFWLIAPAAQRPTTLAVLPFKSLEARDESLVAGMWEDTRQAISRNPQLVVLGPHTSRELAEMKGEAARRTADYLLEGSVRTAGGMVRLTASLVRSRDGAQVWSATFDDRLDNVFALQAKVANEIEGQIRGRLARGGGVQPENIATSAAVYLLYSEARAAIRKRDATGYVAAHGQLKQAVRMDPNFAPAWATLSVAEYMARLQLTASGSTGNEPVAYARRAIQLAPNLASGHAALGLALGRNGPIAEAALRRAVALDPNDVESLHWLASLEMSKGRWKKALELYDRAMTIEPLWWPAVLTRLRLFLELEQADAVKGELQRLSRLGDARLAMQAQVEVLEWRGDYSEALRTGLAFYRQGSDEDRGAVRDGLASLLLRLGYIDEAYHFSSAPAAAPYMWRNDPKGLAMLEARKLPPKVFWKLPPMTEVASRTYFALGRQARLVEMYQGAAASPEEFLVLVEHPARFVHLAPILAVAFTAAGQPAEAERLLAAADQLLTQPTMKSPSQRDYAIHVARVRSAQGRLPDAVAALRKAIDGGWLPVAPLFKPDLEADPPLALLTDIAEFQQLRRRILARLSKERAELGPLDLQRVNSRSVRATK